MNNNWPDHEVNIAIIGSINDAYSIPEQQASINSIIAALAESQTDEFEHHLLTGQDLDDFDLPGPQPITIILYRSADTTTEAFVFYEHEFSLALPDLVPLADD